MNAADQWNAFKWLDLTTRDQWRKQPSSTRSKYDLSSHSRLITWSMTKNLHPCEFNLTGHFYPREFIWKISFTTWKKLTNHLHHLKQLDQSPSPLETTWSITFTTWNNLTNHLHYLEQLDQSPTFTTWNNLTNYLHHLKETTWPITFTTLNKLANHLHHLK